MGLDSIKILPKCGPSNQLRNFRLDTEQTDKGLLNVNSSEFWL